MEDFHRSRGIKRSYSHISTRESGSPCDLVDSPAAQIFSPLPQLNFQRPSYWHTGHRNVPSASNLRHIASTTRARSPLLSPPLSTMPTTTTNFPSNNNHEIIDLTGDTGSPLPYNREIPRHTIMEDDNYNGATLPNSRPNLGTASRAPRFGAEIIDLVDDQEDDQREDEIVYVGTRLIPQPTRQHQPTRIRDPGPEFEITASNALETMPSLPSILRSSHRLLQRMQFGVESMFHMIHSDHTTTRGLLDEVDGYFAMPNIDYTASGFDLGMDAPDRTESTSPASYSAPATAPLGFTRSPQDDDELICPKCHEVLCEGETDLKKQVWAVKSCGHVYCGECTQNRYATKGKRAKTSGAAAAIAPVVFKECVVQGCHSKTNVKKAMFQVYI